MKQIHHIAIKVSDLSTVCPALDALGFQCRQIKHFPEVGMKIAFMESPDKKTDLELLEVVDPQSPAAGDPLGLHHLGIKVRDIEKTFSMMKSNDRFHIKGNIRKGAHSRIFFFQITGQEETLFECVE